MREEKIIEKWEKESYKRGWRDGRKKMIRKIEKIERKYESLIPKSELKQLLKNLKGEMKL
jgi:hypothetical protein